MKKLGLVLCTFLKARPLFVVVITALIAGSFTVTALMKANDSGQANGKKKASQAQPKNDPTADFWQEVPTTQAAVPSGEAASSGRQVEVQPRRFRAFTLNRDAMQRALAAAPREFSTAARQ